MATAAPSRPLPTPKRPRTASPRLLTVADYDRLEGSPPGGRDELWDGRVEMAPAPGYRHQEVVAQLNESLRRHVQQHALGRVILGPVDVLISARTVLQPDLMFVAADTKPTKRFGRDGYLHPTLVVEIVSPRRGKRDRVDKFVRYESAAISHYWVVDPSAETIDAFSLVNGIYQPDGSTRDGTFTAPPLPDLKIVLADLFAA